MMNASIAKRGPDASGIFHDAVVSLGHARLSIIDLSSSANQPMYDHSGRFVLVFNGEIYNYLTLREELARDFQAVFQTNSDTEVLLNGLVYSGIDFLQKCNGFFTFGFYNLDSTELIIGRDRFGIKPLYYHFDSGVLTFGSNLKSIQVEIGKGEIDKRSLSSYLQLSYIPAPNTILRGVKKLMPGHYLKINPAGHELKKYYSSYLYTPENKVTLASSTKHFKSLLQESVALRLQADVEVGTFLSGGFDSSVISLLASKMRKDISAFTLGFPDLPFYDESSQASSTARHLGINHLILPLSDTDVASSLPDFLNSIDEPFADSSAVLVNLLSAFAQQHVKVILSGDGADETLGGYHKHRALLRATDNGLSNKLIKKIWPIIKHFPEARENSILNQFRKFKRYSEGLKYSPEERYERWASWTSKEDVANLLLKSELPYDLDVRIDPEDFNSILQADVQLVLPNDMLYKVDAMSMHHGLEVRVPFLDHQVVEWVARLPHDLKLNFNQGKLLLRKAFESDFPQQHFQSGKKGFEAPLRQWYLGALADWRKSLLDPDFIAKQGIFEPKTLLALERKAMEVNSAGAPQTLWAVLIFQHWYREQLN